MIRERVLAGQARPVLPGFGRPTVPAGSAASSDRARDLRRQEDATFIIAALCAVTFTHWLWCKRWRSSQLGAWKSPWITQQAPHSKSRERFCI